MGTIQGGIGAVSTATDHLSISVENVQTLAVQCRENDAWMAYSQGGLDHESSRFKLSQFESTDGTSSAGLVLEFPHAPYSGTLWFKSTSGATESKIVVWSVQCGSRMY
jgi:hypothetical protein